MVLTSAPYVVLHYMRHLYTFILYCAVCTEISSFYKTSQEQQQEEEEEQQQQLLNL